MLTEQFLARGNALKASWAVLDPLGSVLVASSRDPEPS